MKILLMHTAYSLARLAAGVGISMVAGTVLGICIGYFRLPKKVLMPLIYLLAPIPKIALLPLVMLWFGIGEWAKVFLIILVMLFQVILAVSSAVAHIPEEYYLPLRTAGAGPWFLISQVVLPGCLPELFTALRVGLATGISVLFFAETFGTRWGLGFFVMDMWMRLDYPRMAMGICVLGIIGLGTTIVVDGAEKRLCPWHSREG